MSRKAMAVKKKAAKKKTVLVTTGTIMITDRNYIENPSPLSFDAGSQVVWQVFNNDSEDHSVSIDPATMTNKGSGKLDNPFGTKKPLVASPDPVPAGGQGVLFATLKAKGNFPGRKNSFKYAIASKSADGATTRILDPDLEVIDPNKLK